jgi:hypothetical protein
MAKRVDYWIRRASHFLHNADLGADGLQLVNDAGQYMLSLHEWQWCEGRSSEIELVEGTSEYAVPSDIIEVHFIVHNERTYDVNHVDWADLVRRETISSPPSGWYTVALQSESGKTGDSVGGQNDGIPRTKIRLFPAPEADGTATIIYRRGWSDLRTPDDVVGIPAFMETLYEQILRAFAKGLHQDDTASLHVRLDAITGVKDGSGRWLVQPSSIFTNTKQSDGMRRARSTSPGVGAAGAQAYGSRQNNPRVYPGSAEYFPPEP